MERKHQPSESVSAIVTDYYDCEYTEKEECRCKGEISGVPISVKMDDLKNYIKGFL